jgi:short-subunit dehydrogenase involved in D-alanine esterification of teichoic acids
MNTDNQTVAIVTGGGSGIGLAITEKFVQNNITTVIVGRGPEKLHQAKSWVPFACPLLPTSATSMPFPTS